MFNSMDDESPGTPTPPPPPSFSLTVATKHEEVPSSSQDISTVKLKRVDEKDKKHRTLLFPKLSEKGFVKPPVEMEAMDVSGPETGENQIKVTIIQDFACPGGPDDRIAHLERVFKRNEGSDFFIVPENYLCVSCVDPEKNDTVKKIAKVVKQCGVYFVLSSVIILDKEGTGSWVAAILFDRGGKIMGVHKKRYQAGRLEGDDDGVFDVPEFGIKVGILICLEVEHPTLMSRSLKHGPRIIFNPALISKDQHMDNRKFVVARESLCDKLEKVCCDNNIFIVRCDYPYMATSQVMTPYSTHFAPVNGRCVFSYVIDLNNNLQEKLYLKKPYLERSYEKDNTGLRYRLFKIPSNNLGSLVMCDPLRFIGVFIKEAKRFEIWDFNKFSRVRVIDKCAGCLSNGKNLVLLNGDQKGFRIFDLNSRKFVHQMEFEKEISLIGFENNVLSICKGDTITVLSLSNEGLRGERDISVKSREAKMIGGSLFVKNGDKIEVWEIESGDKLEKEFSKISKMKVQNDKMFFLTIDNCILDDNGRLIVKIRKPIKDFICFESMTLVVTEERNMVLYRNANSSRAFQFLDLNEIENIISNGTNRLFLVTDKEIRMMKFSRNRAKVSAKDFFK